MNSPELYIAAAELLSTKERNYSCVALDEVCQRHNFSIQQRNQTLDFYATTFSPKSGGHLHSYNIFAAVHEGPFKYSSGTHVLYCKKCRNFRIWLLCMMAASCGDL